MKKSIFKTVLPLLAVALVGVVFVTSCEKAEEQSSVVALDHLLVEKSSLAPEAASVLDSLLEHNCIAMDSMFVANSMSDLQQSLNYTGPNIEFARNTLLFGWVTSPSHPSTIDSTYLTSNAANGDYTFNVDVMVNIPGYCVIEKLYFWAFYPKINGNIAMRINYSYVNQSTNSNL